MGVEIIADKQGAVLYNNTSMAAYSPIVRHPDHPKSKELNRSLAELTRKIYYDMDDRDMKKAYEKARELVTEKDINLEELKDKY